MPYPPREEMIYAMAISINLTQHCGGLAVVLEIKESGSWFSAEPVSADIIQEIELAASNPSGDGTVFGAPQVKDGRLIEFLVDRYTEITGMSEDK